MSRRRKGVGRQQQLTQPEDEANPADSSDEVAVDVQLEEPSETQESDKSEDEVKPEFEVKDKAPETKPEPDLLRDDDGKKSGEDVSVGGPPKPVTNFRPKHPLTMGPNKSVMSRRGRLNQGDEVRETDFDTETLNRLIEIGCVLDSRK